MKYRVHLFAHVRVPIEVEAEDQESAVAKAIEDFSENYRTYLWPGEEGEAEYAEDFESDVLVDEVGDTEYDRSMWWKAFPDGTIRLAKTYDEGKTTSINNEDPVYPHGDWRGEVASGDTMLGYWDWLKEKRKEDCNAAGQGT